MFCDEVRVDETMRRAGVDQSGKRSRNRFGVEGYVEGQRVRKSGRVESEDEGFRAGGVNAILTARGLRRIAI